MSFGPSVNFVCQRALRLIGDFPIRASGPRPEAMEEAGYWLDMIVAHVAALQKTWWLTPATQTFTLTAGERTYDLAAVLGKAKAPNGLQVVSQIHVLDTEGLTELSQPPLMRRQEFDEMLAQHLSDEGVPSACYIDRMRDPTLQFLEAPAEAYQVRIVFQGYAPKLTNTKDLKLLTSFREGWSMYLVTALAARIGNGAVRKLPADEVRNYAAEAEKLLFELQAYDAHEQQTERRVRFHNLG